MIVCRRSIQNCVVCVLLIHKHLLVVLLIAHWIMFTFSLDATEGSGERCQESWNVSVVLISWRPPAVRVSWRFPPSNSTPAVAKFELTYRPLNARYRVVHDVSAEQRSLTLKPLQPGTEYQVYLVAFAITGHTNISGKVHFVSPNTAHNESWSSQSEEPLLEEEAPVHFTVREEEVVIVVMVLAVWVFVIVLFFNKWGKIRMLEPYQPQYQSHPVIPKPPRIPLNDGMAPLERFNMEFGAATTSCSLAKMRQRQNSVFVGSPYRSRSGSMLSEPRMPRKVKSAEDLKSLVIQVGDRTLQQSTAL